MVHTEIREDGIIPPQRKISLTKISSIDSLYRLGSTLARILQSSSMTMRTQEICSTKTAYQAETFINPPLHPWMTWPISGRPDSFVYRFRMLGSKLGSVPRKISWMTPVNNLGSFSTMERNGKISEDSSWKPWKTLALESELFWIPWDSLLTALPQGCLSSKLYFSRLPVWLALKEGSGGCFGWGGWQACWVLPRKATTITHNDNVYLKAGRTNPCTKPIQRCNLKRALGDCCKS